MMRNSKLMGLMTQIVIGLSSSLLEKTSEDFSPIRSNPRREIKH